MNLDYDIDEIKLSVTLRVNDDALVHFVLSSEVVSDETLHMIFLDIDKELERKGYAR